MLGSFFLGSYLDTVKRSKTTLTEVRLYTFFDSVRLLQTLLSFSWVVA